MECCGRGEDLFFAVGVTDRPDVAERQDVSGPVGVGSALVTDFGRGYFGDPGFDARRIAPDDEVLRRRRRENSQSGPNEKKCLFHG